MNCLLWIEPPPPFNLDTTIVFLLVPTTNRWRTTFRSNGVQSDAERGGVREQISREKLTNQLQSTRRVLRLLRGPVTRCAPPVTRLPIAAGSLGNPSTDGLQRRL